VPEPRAFKLRQAENRSANYGELPEIDEERSTAVLVRQSSSGADTRNAESRETQLGLQDYGRLLYRRRMPDVRLYDEKSGVSGQKRIDQRAELDRLYQDMHKGIVGTILLTREDRLFRNKHMDQVGAFTKLAEERRIKVIVPPISSIAITEETRVYDFTVYQDLRAFQEKMREAYAYIEGPIKHAHQCKQNKADKGGYDGRLLPPGFALKGNRPNRFIVVYEPWAKEIRKLALRAQALDWDMGKIYREVAGMAYLFPEIPEEDSELYTINTTLRHIPSVGYKPRKPQTIRNWLTNEMYIGWWQPNIDQPDVIIDHHDAILDYALFTEGYARLTGYTLEGEPVENYRGMTRIRKDRETPPDGLFHGRLLATPPSPERTAYTYIDDGCYEGHSLQADGLLIEQLFRISVPHFDNVVINRLKVFVDKDRHIADRVKTTLEQVYNQQGEDFVSIHEQLTGIEIQLAENAKKRMKTRSDDPMYAMLQKEADGLLLIKARLEAKKERLGIMDSPEEIAELHSLLENFEAVWPKFNLTKRQRTFSLLINRIEVKRISPHWLRLSIDWLDALCPRIDVAYLWKAVPGSHATFEAEELEIIRRHYATAPRLDLQWLLPNRTWSAIQTAAQKLLHVKRPVPSGEHLPSSVSYRDLMPELDGRYLFGDYETTLQYIQIGDRNTVKGKKPLYPIWLLSESVWDILGDLTPEVSELRVPTTARAKRSASVSVPLR
jgi:hypothetical protein